MRIGVTTLGCDAGRSGIGKYVIALLQEMPKLAPEHEFVIAVVEGEQEIYWADSPNVTYDILPKNTGGVKQSLLWHLKPLSDWVRRHKIDVLFLPAGNRRLPFSCPCPTVGTVHDLSGFHVEAKYDSLRMFYIKRVLPAMIRRLSRVVTVSKSSASDIRSYAHVDSARITIIANGYDPNTFYVTPAKRTATVDRVLQPGAPYWIYLSRIEHPGKNHVGLIQAYELMAKEDPSIPDLICAGGDWDGSAEVHARHEASPFKDRIHFTGFVPDGELTSLVGGAEACVYPSLYEGFGIPVIEAMACGVPVACSNTSSLPEVGGDAALYFDPADPTSIASALRRLPAERESLIAKGLARAPHFTWHACAKSTLKEIVAAGATRN